MPLAPDEVQSWKEKTMEPMISQLTFEQHLRLNNAAPDRLPGVLAAQAYLASNRKPLKGSTIALAFFAFLAAVTVAAMVWGR